MKKIKDGDRVYIVTDNDANLLAEKMPNAVEIMPTRYKEATHTINPDTLEPERTNN